MDDPGTSQVHARSRILIADDEPDVRQLLAFNLGGSVPSLAMAIDLHRTRGMPEGNRLTTGTVDPWVVPFDPARSGPLLALLQILAFAR